MPDSKPPAAKDKGGASTPLPRSEVLDSDDLRPDQDSPQSNKYGDDGRHASHPVSDKDYECLQDLLSDIDRDGEELPSSDDDLFGDREKQGTSKGSKGSKSEAEDEPGCGKGTEGTASGANEKGVAHAKQQDSKKQ